MLIVENAKKSFPGFSLDIEKLSFSSGRVCGLVGHNGAGQSTLLKLMAGIIPDGFASVHIDDVRLATPCERRKRISFAPDRPALYDWMTPLQFISFFANAVGCDKGNLCNALQRFRVPETKKIRDLSQGNRVKLGLLTTLEREAEFVLLDEPLGALDLEAREQALDYIREQLGRPSCPGFVFSSHNVMDIEDIASDVVILRKGQCVLQRSLKDLQSGYLVGIGEGGLESRNSVSEKSQVSDRSQDGVSRNATLREVFLHFAGRESA